VSRKRFLKLGSQHFNPRNGKNMLSIDRVYILGAESFIKRYRKHPEINAYYAYMAWYLKH
jgi:hypothetical protein